MKIDILEAKMESNVEGAAERFIKGLIRFPFSKLKLADESIEMNSRKVMAKVQELPRNIEGYLDILLDRGDITVKSDKKFGADKFLRFFLMIFD